MKILRRRVDRVLSFFSTRPNWDSSGVCVPPLWFRLPGGTYSLAGEGVGVPIRTRGRTLWYSRYICTLCLEGWNRTHFEENMSLININILVHKDKGHKVRAKDNEIL